MAIQRPRTRVGNISAQSMLGTGPNPITKKQKYSTTQTVETAAFATFPILTKLPITNTMRVIIRTGIV